MKNFALFLASTLLAATSTSAAPSAAQWATAPAHKSGSSKFTLQQMRNEKFRGDDPTGDLLKSHMRFGDVLPAWLKSVVDLDSILQSKFNAIAAAGDAASVPAISPESFDSEYVIPVYIGTPAQMLPLNLDTGSSDL
jgi:aspergillopepsin I